MRQFVLQLEGAAPLHTHVCPSCHGGHRCARQACMTSPAKEGQPAFFLRELACLSCATHAEPRLDGPCLAAPHRRHRHEVYQEEDGTDVCIACAARVGARLKRWCISAAPMKCPTCGSTKVQPHRYTCSQCPPPPERKEWPGRQLALMRMMLGVSQ